MTRTDAIAIIAAGLADLDKLDDAQLGTIAEVLTSAGVDTSPLRRLSQRERALLSQSQADFAGDRSYSLEESRCLLDEKLARLGIPKSTA